MSRVKGDAAEETATRYLLGEGYSIIDRNVYVGKKEIDIIALKDEVLHFVEVKSGDRFEPIYNITQSKLQNLIYAISLYMNKKCFENDFMLDALIIKNGNIEHIENITI